MYKWGIYLNQITDVISQIIDAISPFLWNVAMNSVPFSLEDVRVKVVAHADD